MNLKTRHSAVRFRVCWPDATSHSLGGPALLLSAHHALGLCYCLILPKGLSISNNNEGTYVWLGLTGTGNSHENSLHEIPHATGWLIQAIQFSICQPRRLAATSSSVWPVPVFSLVLGANAIPPLPTPPHSFLLTGLQQPSIM